MFQEFPDADCGPWKSAGFGGEPLRERSYVVDIPHRQKFRMGSCGIAGCINIDGSLIAGSKIEKMITTMGERENGLGAGFVCYGLFPDYAEEYCLQVLYENEQARVGLEEFLSDRVYIIKDEKVKTAPVQTMKPPFPLVWRYFIRPKTNTESFWRKGLEEKDYMVHMVMQINQADNGAFCVSSGKNMAVFKGSGYAKEIAQFYDIGRYKGNMWLSHSRFPTNSPGWWAGSHPISILDWSICHNGEITSYGVNKKLVEMAGYKCSLLTDSEVITYLWDLLVRRHGLPIQAASFAMAPWYYKDIDRLEEQMRLLALQLRITYKEAFLNGPFSILVGRSEPDVTMIALADRKKLRPLVLGASEDGNSVFAASEECAIKAVQKDAETWAPKAGNPVIVRLGEGIVRHGTEEPFQGVRM
ncbi:MAG: glutamine amidotransferase family protein [Candidatus Methanomethylophilaceae archaeon]|jgi:glutamate synthase domain-containing protein 1